MYNLCLNLTLTIKYNEFRLLSTGPITASMSKKTKGKYSNPNYSMILLKQNPLSADSKTPFTWYLGSLL